MNANDFVELLNELKGEQRPFSLGVIDPAYTTGLPKIIFDGDDTPSLKGYSFVSGYNPSAGDRVVLANIGATHVILGGVTSNGSDTGWRQLTVGGGYTDYAPTNWSDIGYQKANGRVQLTGLVVPPATITGTEVMFTLPATCRPKRTMTFPVMYSKNAVISVGQFNINSAGVCTINTSAVGGAGWLSLDSVSFIVDGGQPV